MIVLKIVCVFGRCVALVSFETPGGGALDPLNMQAGQYHEDTSTKPRPCNCSSFMFTPLTPGLQLALAALQLGVVHDLIALSARWSVTRLTASLYLS